MQKERGEGFFTASNTELAAIASENQRVPVSVASVACGIAVFRELGLIETRTAYVSGESMRSIRVRAAESKVELTDSVRYREGLDEREIFHSFREWAIKSQKEKLHTRVSGPILPDGATR